jgi:uncharacterized membrane protein YkoI
MTPRFSLILAAVVTGFLLVALGGVVGRVTSAGASEAPAAAPQMVAAPTADLVAMMQQRDAAYRQLIERANIRLQQAQTVAEPTPAPYPITPDQALLIATSVAGGTQVRPPELVDVQGTVAYEVALTTGTYYVDATTGRILKNNTPATVTIVRSSGGGHGEHEDHEGSEHEGGDD